MRLQGRRTKSIRNTVTALLSEVLVMAAGFLMPRAIIENYGSEANGLVTSLQQFIQYFTLVEGGLAGAALFALYKPLAESDDAEIRSILYAAKKMYQKSGGIYLVLLSIGAFVYPLLIAETGFSYQEVVVLFLLIGLNGATQLLFVGKYKVLLNATQNNRVSILINSVSTCLYSLIIVVASYCHIPVAAAVALAVTAYLLRAVAFYFSAKRMFPQYRYEKSERVHRFVGQKEVFIQQILSMIVLNCGTLVLTFTKTDMAEISVYNVYNMVLTAVFLVAYCVDNGVAASFGDLIARNDEQRLRRAYKEFEVLFQIFWTVLFACVSVLYRPFIRLYAGEFTDAQYARPVLCILFSALGGVWVIRNQQSVPVTAAGRFKQMQKGHIIEAILAVGLCIGGLLIWGLEGMLAGRLLAAIYRAVDLTVHNSKHVVKTKIRFTVGHILWSTAVILVINVLFALLLSKWNVDTVPEWLALAVLCGVSSVGLSIAVVLVTNREMIRKWLGVFFQRIK